jgi:hypothetical protein
MIIVHCLLWCMWLASVLVMGSVPAEIQVGGLFAPVAPNGNLYTDQAEHIAAFVMAINEINNKTDGIHDDLLPNTTLTYAVRADQAMTGALTNALTLESLFGGSGVVAVVNALHNANALVVTQLFGTLKVMSLVTVTNSGQFDEAATYPYVANVRPLVSRHGMVIQNRICALARKVVVFAGTDPDDIQMMRQFQDESICELDILALISVRGELTDLSDEIATAKPTGSRYFVLFLLPEQNALLIEQGYAAGLFHENTVIFTSSNGAVNITEYFSPATDVARVMTGVFTHKYVPNYYLKRAPTAIAFAQRWRRQQSTTGVAVNGKTVCDAATDNTGNFLYKAVIDNVTTCTGLNFAKYTSSGSNIKTYTPLTYDATIMLAMALDLAISNDLDYTNPLILKNLMSLNVSFDGASGPVNLFHGYPQYENDARGVRNAGTQYRATNFNPDLYNNGSEAYMVTIGFFDGDTREFTACAPIDRVTCFPPTYSAATDGSYSNPPSDTPPIIYKKLTPTFRALCFCMVAIIVVLVVVFGSFTYRRRQSKVIRTAQPVLLLCILVGGLIAAARIVFGGLQNSDTVCSSEIWLGHLAFVVMIGSLFVKSYRVHCIVNTRKLVRVTFSAYHAFRLLVVIVTCIIAYLAVMQSIGKPHMRYLESVVENQQTNTAYCALEFSQFQTALYAVELVLMVVSFRVCWEIRNVPDVVNESKQISTG